ncbi:hypothetical protein AKJ16_DCAP09074 [Drosera capensis]
MYRCRGIPDNRGSHSYGFPFYGYACGNFGGPVKILKMMKLFSKKESAETKAQSVEKPQSQTSESMTELEKAVTECEKILDVEVIPAAVTSCHKKKSEDTTFFKDLKDHFDEFIHASNDERKACLKETVQKTFVMPKIFRKSEAEGIAEEQASDEYVTRCQAQGTPSADAVNFVNSCCHS